MLIAKINEVGEIVEVADYRQWFKTIPTEQELIDKNFMKVNVYLQHDKKTQKVAPTTPYIMSGWVYTIKVEDLTEEEKQSVIDSEAANVRAIRNKMLSDCDWTQIEDSTADKVTWKTYRQSLRDITNQENFPWEIVWPTDPNSQQQNEVL
jgi:hypothetical protein